MTYMQILRGTSQHRLFTHHLTYCSSRFFMSFVLRNSLFFKGQATDASIDLSCAVPSNKYKRTLAVGNKSQMLKS